MYANYIYWIWPFWNWTILVEKFFKLKESISLIKGMFFLWRKYLHSGLAMMIKLLQRKSFSISRLHFVQENIHFEPFWAGGVGLWFYRDSLEKSLHLAPFSNNLHLHQKQQESQHLLHFNIERINRNLYILTFRFVKRSFKSSVVLTSVPIEAE